MADILNPAQKQAVTTTEGFIRLVAGAGTGKTKTLVHRYAYLINEIGVLPENILCVTFTNKAAVEMRTRIRKLVGDCDTGFVCTFHSFCVSVLQEESYAIQYPKSFLVLDNSDINSMLNTVYEERGLTLKDRTFGNARDMIEIRKTQTELDYYKYLISFSLAELEAKYRSAQKTDDIIFYGYLYQQKKCFGIDYNDLLVFVMHIFDINQEIREKWQTRLEYIMIDEFQDIDDIQYRLMETLCVYHQNLFVVGDPDQTIYTWRGANIRYLLEFDKKFPLAETILMKENYRSEPEILDAVNSLIDKNQNRIKKDLVFSGTGVPLKKKPVFFHGKDPEVQYRWIADKIRELNGEGVSCKDIAILYRAHYLTRGIEECFLDETIPYTIFSGIPFFDREEIKDALSYLRMILYKDDLSFRRIVNKPKRNIGKTRIELLEQYSAEAGCTLYEAMCKFCDEDKKMGTQSPFSASKAGEFIELIEHYSERLKNEPNVASSQLLFELLTDSGYEHGLRTEGNQTKLDNLAELKQGMYEFEQSCGEDCNPAYYLSQTAFMNGLDAGNTKNAVRLMTVHTAKGLEFDYVFVCDLNEAIFPSKKIRTKEEMEEERRLAFVAMTRAKKGLFLTESEGFALDGGVKYPSRFIFDIKKEFLLYETPLNDSFVNNASRAIKDSDTLLEHNQLAVSLLAGTRINHPVLGKGTILETDGKNQRFVIQFDALKTPRKISFLAKLTPVD